MNASRPRRAEVIGDPIAQSKSPLIHGFWLKKLELAGTYSSTQVPQGELGEYLARSKADADWLGCNVTMPHKQDILPLLDSLDPLAERLSAANTVVRQPDNTLKGFNTDVEGFLEPLLPVLSQQHLFRMARVIGTGGAARAICAGLDEHGFTLVLAGRDPAKAQQLLTDIAPHGEHHTPPLSHFAEPTDFDFDDREGCLDLVVNASPLGMAGHPPLPFDWSHAPPGSIAYDIVTSPADTAFLQDARRAGHQTIGGFAMLIGQAASAFERFFGVTPPRRYDHELQELLAQ